MSGVNNNKIIDVIKSNSTMKDNFLSEENLKQNEIQDYEHMNQENNIGRQSQPPIYRKISLLKSNLKKQSIENQKPDKERSVSVIQMNPNKPEMTKVVSKDSFKKHLSLTQNLNFNFNKKESISNSTFNKKSILKKQSTFLQRKMSQNKISLVDRKSNFFEVSHEDEIFDDINQNVGKNIEDNTNFMKRIKESKSMPKMDMIQKKLLTIYKIDPTYVKVVREAKSKTKKSKLDLEQYQNNLVNALNEHVCKDSIRKLSKDLRDLRILTNKIRVDKTNDFINDIEKWEEEIVKNLKKKEEKLDYLRERGKILINSPLPRIRQKKVLK
jgi:hypothetical protein